MLQSQLPVEGGKICPLGGEHFVPFLARFAGGQAVRGLLERGVQGLGFAGLDQQMRGAGKNQLTEVLGPSAFQTIHRFPYFEPIPGGAAKRDVHVRQQSAGFHPGFVGQRD